jgi:hypothetical protein
MVKNIEEIELEFFRKFLKENAGSVSKQYSGCEETVWNEMNQKLVKSYPIEFNLYKTFRFFEYQLNDPNGILSKTFVYRLYSTMDQRNIDEPSCYAISRDLISLETYLGIVREGEYGLIEEKESLKYIIMDVNVFMEEMIFELNRDKTLDPDYIVFYHYDPAIKGDYYAESYDQVYFIGSYKKAMKIYEKNAQIRRGCGTVCYSYSYPVPYLQLSRQYIIGEKLIIHAEREKTEETEFELALENDDDEICEENYPD